MKNKLYLHVVIIVCFVKCFVENVKGQCTDTSYQCDNNKCITASFTCDDEDDCGDNSDETNCGICSSDEFRCNNKDCIEMSRVCNQEDDCGDNSDESEGCVLHLTCEHYQFTCSDHSRCITDRWVCDHENDCNDGSDEYNCGPIMCSDNQFKCKESSMCIPLSWACDGDVDCTDDSSDENNCTAPVTELCNGLYTCDNGDCIHNQWKCDGEDDCGDNSDENEITCPFATCAVYHITCNNGDCVYGFPCDQNVDCQDGSDEQNCPTEAPSEQCVINEQFQCDDGSCISIGQFCDGTDDCIKGDDEPVGQSCGACREGYKQSADNSTCLDINECADIKGLCSHTCLNEEGSFTCECYEGFTLRNNTDCKADGPPAAIIYVYHNSIRMYNKTSIENLEIFHNLKHPFYLDVDISSGNIFWSDIQEKSIMMGNIEGDTKVVALVQTENVAGIAYDWIQNNMYWITNAPNYTVNVISGDGVYQKTLFSEDIDEPESIVVNPLTGYIYWASVGSNPKIERAGMDGTSRSILISDTMTNIDIEWPNGLTIDYILKKLYWVEAKHHVIMSCDLNGDNVDVIIQDPSVLRYPFEIVLFEDDIYWTDWESHAIGKANKFTGTADVDVLTGLHNATPNGIRVWHPSTQPIGPAHCGTQNGGCSHLCVSAPGSNINGPAHYTCLCPDKHVMSVDGRTCSHIFISTSTTPTSSLSHPLNVIDKHSKKKIYHQQNSDEKEPEPAPKNLSPIIVIVVLLIMLVVTVVILISWVLWRKNAAKDKTNHGNIPYHAAPSTEASATDTNSTTVV